MPDICWIYGIAFNCPYLERKEDCPLLTREHFSLIEKAKWITELDIKKKQSILQHHLRCSKIRETNFSKKHYHYKMVQNE